MSLPGEPVPNARGARGASATGVDDGDRRPLAATRRAVRWATAALDSQVVKLFERRMTASAAAPSRSSAAPTTGAGRGPADARARLIELADAYRDGTLGQPSPFFAAPPMPAIEATPHGAGPLGTRVLDLAWASDHVPFLPAAREPYLRFTANARAHARLWTSDRGRPTLVLIHGWGGGHPWVTERTFAVSYWLRHGFDVAAFVLPFHGARAPGGPRGGGGPTDPAGPGGGGSGALFPSANVTRTNEAFGQAIFDLRALALELRRRGASAVGAMGMSLGGYTTALWASVAGPDEPGGLDAAVAMIPLVSLSRLMWRHGEASPIRRRAQGAGVSEDLLADAFAVHAPTTRPPRLPAERLAIVAGHGDRVTPPDQALELSRHWGVPVRWFDGGHLAQLGRSDALRDVRQQLGRLAFPGQLFRGGTP